MQSSHAQHAVGSLPTQRIAQRYVVESEIARGGMGVVYRVREQGSGAVYALKRIRLDTRARSETLLAAFAREYQVLASLDHPGIIRVFDYGIDGDQPYYTMELVEGRDLRQLAPLPWRAACGHLREVASALSLLHARRLIHRDLSPGNVKITKDGRAKLLDFGALMEFGYSRWLVGTPPMIPPEALDGGMLDQRADLYALGALAYFLLTTLQAFPAERIEDLPAVWRRVPPLPSTYNQAIPSGLDALVTSLLSANPLARPSSAAEVIARLNGIAALEPEDEDERRRLARSFLALPPFIGRDAQMNALAAKLTGTLGGKGHALAIHGVAGSGRTRLLEEAGVRAQLAGATVLRVDASMHPGAHGTSRALIARSFEALPELTMRIGQRFRAALGALGDDVLAKLDGPGVVARPSDPERMLGGGELAAFFLAMAEVKPLLLQVDNGEYVDGVGLGLLATLAREAPSHRLLLMVAARSDPSEPPSLGMRTLRELMSAVELPVLTPDETLALVRSMFGDVPNLARFAERLHDLTAGNPLLTVELARQQVERGDARYQDGMWQLPSRKDTTRPSVLLHDLLATRIGRLSPSALDLARCLGVSRVTVDFALCARLCNEQDERGVGALLDELARCDVMVAEQGAYHFSSAALREVLLANSAEPALEASHLRVGRALLASENDAPERRINAGWHLIRGREELEGADLICAVVGYLPHMLRLHADMHGVAAPLEAALQVYRRHGRPVHMCLPLLCGLAHSGFFEDVRYGNAYAEEALHACAEFAGMRLARQLRFLGRHLALYLALVVAALRWAWLPRRERPFAFAEVMNQLFATTLSSVAVATVQLDANRAERMAAVIDPFSAMPARATASALYRFCSCLQQMAREHQAESFRAFERILDDFTRRDALRMVPPYARILFVCAAHFARGTFATFRDDGRAALESADALEASGVRIYAMVGSQLRYLYHLNRGEPIQAEPHRARVELHAAHFGTAWQVELWEAPALLPLQLALDDPASAARFAHQIEQTAASVPSLQRYARLGRLVALELRGGAGRTNIERFEQEMAAEVPRSFVGWTTAAAAGARSYSQLGDHTRARDWCTRALAVTTVEDREYVTLFLMLDLQTAIADAALGDVTAAMARLDGLIARFAASQNPLTVGRLHETRARIAWQAQQFEAYEHSLRQVERWFGHSGAPALVAKYERLAELQRPPDTLRGRLLPANTNAQGSTLLDPTELDTEV